MPLQGPIVVVAEAPDGALVRALSSAGAFPVVETSWSDAPATVSTSKPGAVVVADLAGANKTFAEALAQKIGQSEPLLPMIVLLRDEDTVTLPGALPIASDAPPERLVGRISSALRLRALHATVLARAGKLRTEHNIVAEPLVGDPIDDATVVVVGRGRLHPALSVAVGERMGVMGALSVDAAARCLLAREIDGVVICDGLPGRGLEAFFDALAANSRLRELPIGLLGAGRAGAGSLPNWVRAREPATLVERMMPMVRMHAFETRLQRLLKSIESNGVLDAWTGLLKLDAFRQLIAHAIDQAVESAAGLSLAGFSFEQMFDRRASLDAARLASRLVREGDFACRQHDGSLLFAFPGTDLRTAHVLARRIASALKHTMLRPVHRPDITPNGPDITLATLKPGDTVVSLLARASPRPVAAA
jgi:hypothetical protein